jgi:hypothetical protein
MPGTLAKFKRAEQKRQKEVHFGVTQVLAPEQQKKQPKPLGSGSKPPKFERTRFVHEKLKDMQYLQVVPHQGNYAMVENNAKDMQKYIGKK